MSAPRVSLCLPAFNNAGLLRLALECALAQTYPDFELIVSDDASTDETAQVVASFSDPRIRYSRNSCNLGLVGNWNRAVELARGEFLGVWHQDDLYYPELLTAEVGALEQNPTIAYAYVACDLIDASGRPLRVHRPFVGNHVWPAEKEFAHLVRNCFPAAPLMRRAALEQVGLFNQDLVYAADWELLLRLSTRWGAAYIDRVLAAYRFHASNTTRLLRQKRTALGLDQCAALDCAFALHPPFPALARYHHVAYAELGQRLLIEGLREARGRRYREAWHWFSQALSIILRRVGPAFVGYSIADAIHFFRTRAVPHPSLFDTPP